MSHPVVRPIQELGGRRQEQGRIRFGVKTARAMKAIDTFRFTSPDREAVAELAALYGGECVPWHDVKANPQDQFEVVTGASAIRVFIPPGGLDQCYEKWSGAGCERRCDGVNVELRSSGPDPWTEAPCVCDASQRMECKPKTRLVVLLPEIRFGGVWRLETGSWNAFLEMPTMEVMAQQLQMYGVIEASLSLQKRSDLDAGGKRRHYIVPRLEFKQSVTELVAGAATVGGLGAGDRNGVSLDGSQPLGGPLALGTGSPVGDDSETQAEWYEMGGESGGAADVVDAEVIDVEPVDDPPLAEPEDLAPEDEPFTTAHEDRQADAAAKTTRKATKPAPTPPAGETLAEKTERLAQQHASGLTPQQRKIHAMVGEIVAAHPDLGVGVDEFRHRAVATLTGNRTESSNDLTREEMSSLIDIFQDVLDGVRGVELVDDGVKMRKLAAR